MVHCAGGKTMLETRADGGRGALVLRFGGHGVENALGLRQECAAVRDRKGKQETARDAATRG